MAVVPPLAGETAAVFSIDQLTYDATLGDWRTHDGIDIRAAAGDAVVAAAAGTVLSVGNTSLSEAGLGAHLHFSVARNGETIDPALFLE